MLNVGSGLFFTQGNAYNTQASVGTDPRLVKFQANSATDYVFLDYGAPYGSTVPSKWFNVFFDSETALYIDRNGQANYFFAVEDNGETFRISTSANNPTFGDYADAGLYVGVPKSGNTTALSPFVDEDEAYVDWAIVTKDSYDALANDIAIYEKAQELKEWIDRIEAQNGDATSLSNVYLNEDATMEELQAAIDSAQPILIQALINNAADPENVDVTIALANPNYDDGESGWTVEAAAGSSANGRQGNVRPGGSADNQCYEAWNNSNFDIYQTLTDMPVGVYQIEVQGFYRYGRGATAWDAYLAQNVEYVKPTGVPVYIYLNNNATNFVNVFGDDKQITDASFYSTGSSDYSSHTNGGQTYYFPNGMASAAIAFTDGMYKQSAFGLIANEGDPFRIGVKGNSNQLNDSWVIWDNFKLYYRGFKAEVVQPVLETAMTDLQQYATMLMGKTEFAQLNSALNAAQTAIDNNDGQAMFTALNELYNIKESVIASKDLFVAQEVSTDAENLSDAINGVADKKLSQATLQEAQTLYNAIIGNTKYEGTEISQLKEDVAAAITALDNSVAIYTSLKEAIDPVKESVTKKATQTIIDEANTLLATAEPGYENGTLTDNEAQQTTTNLNSKQEALTASITAYESLAAAIARLQTAIDEASASTQHVAKSTLTKANLRLTGSQNAYNNGTVATADVNDRVTAIDELITELTRSIQLYQQFATALESLQTTLAKEDKVSAQTKADAQSLYDNAKQAYDEGTTDDDQVEAMVTSLNNAVTALTNSATLYADLGDAIPTLETAVTQKANKTATDEANALLASTQGGYENATIADDDIPDLIDDIYAKAAAMDASAVEYAKLKDAIDRLEAAIAEVGETATKSTLKKANLRLTASKNLYNNGTIADADIDARVTTINELITELTASIVLRQQYDEAIANLDAAVANAQGNVSDAMMQNATTLQTTIKTDYEQGNVSDDNIPAEIEKINNIVAALEAAPAAYQLAENKQDEITATENKLADALTDIAAAEAKANAAALTGDFKQQADDAISTGREGIGEQQTATANTKNTVENLVASLDNAILTNGSATINSITQQLYSISTTEIENTADNVVTTTEQNIDNIIQAFKLQPYELTIGTALVATLVLPYDAVIPNGVKAYTLEYTGGEKATATEVENTIPADTPVLINADETGTYTFNPVDGAVATDVANPHFGALTGIYTAGKAPIGSYVLQDGDYGLAFYKVATDDINMGANRAYLTDQGQAGARSMLGVDIIDNTITKIAGSGNGNANEGSPVYDLQGRRVSSSSSQSTALKKGLYIVNGKKVVIKKNR